MELNFADFGFYHVDTTYLKHLHDNVDSEVYYSEEKNYERKPFLGIVLNIDNYSYFIPLTSRKWKHTKWKNIGNTHYLIYEIVDRSELHKGDVFKAVPNTNTIFKLFAALDIKKMIPVPEGYFERVDFSLEKDPQYKDLLEKEYRFCQTIQNGILERAEKIYREQKDTGIVHKMYCNFNKLEKACDSYRKE